MLAPARCSSTPFGRAVTPAPALAASEIQRSEVWRDCFHHDGTCTFGPADAKVHVVLFGDSHALQWFPALKAVADRRGWKVTTYLKAACPPNPAPLYSKSTARDRACERWAGKSLKKIAALPDVDTVIFTAFNSKRWLATDGQSTYEAGVNGYRKSWSALLDQGIGHVVAIRDTPRPDPDGVDCVALSDTGGLDCGRARKAALRRNDSWRDRPDPLESAVRASARPEVGLMDLTDAFCQPDTCPAVIGNVLVYIDDDHISPTYARSLAPEFERQLLAAVRPAQASPSRPANRS